VSLQRHCARGFVRVLDHDAHRRLALSADRSTGRSCETPFASDAVCVRRRLCHIPLVSDTACVRYRLCQIPLVSDTEQPEEPGYHARDDCSDDDNADDQRACAPADFPFGNHESRHKVREWAQQ
jgi:hypothetical protein